MDVQQLLLLGCITSLVASHVAADRKVLTCGDSQTFAHALRSAGDVDVRIEGVVRVDPRHFRSAAAVTGGRQLRIMSAGGARRGILDFRGTSDVLFVGDGGTMAMENIKVAGLALANGRASPTADSVFFPTVQLAPGATISFDSVELRYRRHPEFADCSAYQASLTTKLSERYGGNPVVLQPSGAVLLASTAQVSTQLQLESYGQTIGTATIMARNSTFICVEEGEICNDDGCQAEKTLAALWRGVRGVLRSELVTAALGTALAITAVAVCWLLAAQQQTQRDHNTALTAAKVAVAAAQAALSDAGGTSSTTVSRISSQKLDRTSSEFSHPSSFDGSLQGSGPHNLLVSPPGVGGAGRQHLAAETLPGDHHSHLLRMRLEGLEGIEVGPSLGRGSYGRVYKGRWKGALVAIKVVEHTSDNDQGRTDIVEGARESLLAASVSHPNVIPCYKICTVAISRRTGSTDADGFPTSTGGTTSSSGTRATASVVSNEAALAVIAANKAQSVRSTSDAGGGRSVSSGEFGSKSRDGGRDSGDGTFGSRARALASSGGPLRSASSSETEHLAELLYSSDPMRGIAKPRPKARSASMEAFRPAEVEIVADPAQHVQAPMPSADGTQESIETWMLLEFADRGNLEQAIQQKRFRLRNDPSQLDMVSICRSLLDVANGLEYLHSLGIVHGDLKPANVLLKSTSSDPRGFSCKLADFGLSRMLDLNKTHVSTQTYGTLPFMPVELLSEGHMGKSADVYSFAVVMWSLLTGDQPHHGMNTMQVLFNVVNKGMRPPMPDSMPAPYRSLVEACWAQRAEDRPMVQQLTLELSALLKAEVAARQSSSPPAGAHPTGTAAGLQRTKSEAAAPQNRAGPQPEHRGSASAPAASPPLAQPSPIPEEDEEGTPLAPPPSFAATGHIGAAAAASAAARRNEAGGGAPAAAAGALRGDARSDAPKPGARTQ